MDAHFTEAGLKFLRGLERNNEREWFNARKGVYEEELKARLLAVVAAVNAKLETFAPEYVREPGKVAMRIYRDIRFSPDKRPYKTHVAAWWARHGLEKTSGAGFYLHWGPKELVVAAGAYMPDRDQTMAIRRMIEARHEEMRALLAAKTLARLMEPFEPMKMTRVPKGFAADSPAADLLMQRQWGVHSTLPSAKGLEPALVKTVVERFRAAAPLVAMLNEPLVGKAKKPLF